MKIWSLPKDLEIWSLLKELNILKNYVIWKRSVEYLHHFYNSVDCCNFHGYYCSDSMTNCRFLKLLQDEYFH